MFYESNSFDKLQNALDDLHEESNKKGLKNSMFKKLFASLNLEIDELKLHASKLKNKNNLNSPKNKIILIYYLGSQRCVL